MIANAPQPQAKEEAPIANAVPNPQENKTPETAKKDEAPEAAKEEASKEAEAAKPAVSAAA